MWVETTEALGLMPGDKFYPLLVKTYVLSRFLKRLCNHLTLQVISQHVASASVDEQILLNIQENNSFIREVYLCGDEIPWVRGRVVVPFATYQKYKQDFDNLGNKLLGETLLYNKPGITRSDFEYKLGADGLFSRRSIFDLNNYSLLVIETFLANIPLHPF